MFRQSNVPYSEGSCGATAREGSQNEQAALGFPQPSFAEPGPAHRSSFVVLDRAGDRNFMDSEFLLRFARRMRELMLRARTEPAREQLRIWAEEFEARAAAVETEQQGSHGRAGPDNPSNCPSR